MIHVKCMVNFTNHITKQVIDIYKYLLFKYLNF